MGINIKKNYDQNIFNEYEKTIIDYFHEINTEYIDFPMIPAWGNANLGIKNSKRYVRYALYDGSSVIGLFQGVIQGNVIYKYLISGSTSGIGISIHPEYKYDIFKNFLKFILKQENITDFNIFSKNKIYLKNCKIGYQYTYLINIDKDINDIYNNFKKNCRGEIKKAIKNNLKVIFSNSDLCLKKAYILLNNHSRIKGYNIHSYNWYKNLNTMYNNISDFKIVLAISENKIICTNIIIGYGNKINDYNSASTSLGNELGANNYIKYKIIEWAKEKGYKIFDLGGANPSDLQVLTRDKFKQSFGGSLSYNYDIYKDSLFSKYYLIFRKKLKRIPKKLGQNLSDIIID
jgi:lipid II:glycine glycyltransferase (peptidoglycan interpeptide bridge formation enzyme)